MLAQLGHYVNRRNVQAAVFPGLALFFSAGGGVYGNKHPGGFDRRTNVTVCVNV